LNRSGETGGRFFSVHHIADSALRDSNARAVLRRCHAPHVVSRTCINYQFVVPDVGDSSSFEFPSSPCRPGFRLFKARRTDDVHVQSWGRVSPKGHSS
jgi:hypothetical protein